MGCSRRGGEAGWKYKRKTKRKREKRKKFVNAHGWGKEKGKKIIEITLYLVHSKKFVKCMF